MTEFDFRPAHVVALERAFGLRLDERESARCASEEATAAVFAARLGATDGRGVALGEIALGAVREAMREVVGAERESIRGDTSIAKLFGNHDGSTTWARLGQELRCSLPPLRSGRLVRISLPHGLERVEGLAAWLVASNPAGLRPGTEWTRAQVAEVVDAVVRFHGRR